MMASAQSGTVRNSSNSVKKQKLDQNSVSELSSSRTLSKSMQPIECKCKCQIKSSSRLTDNKLYIAQNNTKKQKTKQPKLDGSVERNNKKMSQKSVEKEGQRSTWSRYPVPVSGRQEYSGDDNLLKEW